MSDKRIAAVFFVFLLTVSACQTSNTGGTEPETETQVKAETLWPADLPAVKVFAAGQDLTTFKSLKLPDSPYTLLYAAVARTEDTESWSQDPADGIRAYIFVLDAATGLTDEKLTASLNSRLGAASYYEPSRCGGLGSLDTAAFQVKDKAVIVSRFYAPGTERTNCEEAIVFADGKITVKDTGSGESGLSADAAAERTEMHQKALLAFETGKTDEAAEIWQKMYGFWQNGPYASEGPIQEMLCYLGKANDKKGNADRAKALFQECKNHFPTYSPAILALADAQAKAGEKEAAKLNYGLVKISSASDKDKAYAEEQLKKLN